MTFDYGRRAREIEQNMIRDAETRWGLRPPYTPPLHEAWQDVLDSLPDGWRFDKLYRRDRYWSAWAENTNKVGVGLPGLRGDSSRDSDNPAEALVSLATELRSAGQQRDKASQRMTAEAIS